MRPLGGLAEQLQRSTVAGGVFRSHTVGLLRDIVSRARAGIRHREIAVLRSEAGQSFHRFAQRGLPAIGGADVPHGVRRKHGERHNQRGDQSRCPGCQLEK